ncbi:MAG: hypothetical protein BJ554DRAFT_7566, partial [Olpidium bornovanus]
RRRASNVEYRNSFWCKPAFITKSTFGLSYISLHTRVMIVMVTLGVSRPSSPDPSRSISRASASTISTARLKGGARHDAGEFGSSKRAPYRPTCEAEPENSTGSGRSVSYLHMSRARLASPDTALTFRAQNMTASGSKTLIPLRRDDTILLSCSKSKERRKLPGSPPAPPRRAEVSSQQVDCVRRGDPLSGYGLPQLDVGLGGLSELHAVYLDELERRHVLFVRTGWRKIFRGVNGPSSHLERSKSTRTRLFREWVGFPHTFSSAMACSVRMASRTVAVLPVPGTPDMSVAAKKERKDEHAGERRRHTDARARGLEQGALEVVEDIGELVLAARQGVRHGRDVQPLARLLEAVPRPAPRLGPRRKGRGADHMRLDVVVGRGVA